MTRTTIDVELLRQLWAEGKTHTEISSALGCAEAYISSLQRQHGLPKRKRRQFRPVDYEPTEEEILQMAAELRAKRVTQEQRVPVEIMHLQWDGTSFRQLA
jgi:hypothetical protein